MEDKHTLQTMNSLINEFQNGKSHWDESFIIPPDLFGITKTFIFIEIPYCELSEINPFMTEADII